MTTVPNDLMARLEVLLPEANLSTLKSTSDDRQISFRLTTLKANPDETLAQLQRDGFAPQPIECIDHAWRIEGHLRSELTHHPAAESGLIYIMNPSSMLAAQWLAPQPGEEVLDLAAAPGGKSIHLAELMQNQGRLACVEPIRNRFFRLKANLERCGVNIAQLYQADGRGIGRKVPARFDRVLLDAPCSSEARIRFDDPESWAHWSPRKIKETSKKQRRLLLSALTCVKPGGHVLYSTCSFAPEENEGVVDHAIKRFDGQLEILPITLQQDIPHQNGLTQWQKNTYNPNCQNSIRILPDSIFDGFFLCLIKRIN